MMSEREDAVKLASEVGAGLVALLTKAKWNGRYFVLDGKRVSITTIRKILRRIETVSARRLVRLTEKLYRNEIELADWKTEAMRTITSAHLLAGAVAGGSLEEAERDGYVSANTAKQHRYLAMFETDIRRQKVSQARGVWRIGLYAMAVFMTYSAVERAKNIERGATMAKRLRRASESCAGCVEWSGFWMPVSVLPPIGTLDCKSRCRCYVIYK